MVSFYAVLVSLMFIYGMLAQERELSPADIVLESQHCGASNFHEPGCLQKPDCVFMHWNVNDLGETLRLCLSYNELMRFYVKNPEDYIRTHKARNHRTINRANLCDVLDDHPIFMGRAGQITRCLISTLAHSD